MTLQINGNNLDIFFQDFEKFDPGLLEKLQDHFKKLNPLDDIDVNMYGNIVVETLPYLTEVKKHCKQLVIIIHDDKKAKNFLETLININKG